MTVPAAHAALLDGLDPDQRDGVLAGPGLTVIVAGAGTGKTRVLTTRAVLLVSSGLRPSSIVAVTFTRKAAAEMRERAETMGGGALAGVRFSTLHSLSANIVRRHWRAAGLRSPDFVIADDDEELEIMRAAVETAGLVGGREDGRDKEWRKVRDEAAKEAARVIGRWKSNGLTVVEAADRGRARRGEREEGLAAAYVAYQEGLASRNMLDFDDLTPMAVRALEADPHALDQEAGRIGHLMVDETQDTNRSQMRLLGLLASCGADVTCVGDDDQSIYAFRAAIPRLMERLPPFFPEPSARAVNRVRLVTNRRCTDEILEPANLFVDYNPREEPKVLRSGRSGSAVTVSSHATAEAEADAVASRIEGLVSDGADPGSIAVLVRNRSVADAVGLALLRRRVPHEMQAGTSFLERSEVKDILAYMKLAVDPSQELAFLRIAAKPTRGIGPAAAKAVTEHAAERGCPIHEALAALAGSSGLKGAAREGAAALGRQLAVIADAARSGEPVEDILRYVLDRVGYLDWSHAQKDAPTTLRDSISSLYDFAGTAATVGDLLSDAALTRGAEEAARGAVHVGTLHGSKGLEWDHVLIPGFEEGIIPSERALAEAATAGDPEDPWCCTGGGGLEEERRLAHVGMTRARHTAHVSFAWNRKLYGRDRPSKPSRLLREAELPVPRPEPTSGAKGARSQDLAKRRAPSWV
jgi:DNA helicase-2/ATP-dependent DNA helicase PcrA